MKRSLVLLLVVGSLGAAAPAAASPGQLRSALRQARAPTSQLERAATRESFGVRFYRYRQQVNGLTVLGSGAVVTDAPGARADLLVDGTRALRPPAPARVDRSAARRAALLHVGRGHVRTVELAVLPAGLGSRLVWRVVVAASNPPAVWEALVDARSGEVARVRSLLQEATGTAALFDPNPVVMNGGLNTADGGAADLPTSGNTDDPAFTYLPVTLQRLEETSFCLRGQWVDARRLSADLPVCAPDSARDFSSITRSNSRFEALMAYFHVDRAQAYVQSLGFANVMNRQLVVHADAIPDDNSYYDPSTKDITLGRGGFDDGEDAETIVHEYGHAIQDDQVPGYGTSDDALAMGEGFGDYFASAIAKNNTPDPRFDGCWDEWDGYGLGITEDPPCLRRVDYSLHVGQTSPDCPVATDEHCRGEVWSGALWAIRGAIGGATTDRLVIQSHFSLTPGASFAAGSQALLAADGSLYGGAHTSLIESVLRARGLIAPSGGASGGSSPAAGAGAPGVGGTAPSDRDGDGVPDADDDCPARADPRQADWDRDGRGDACDASSKVSITSVKRRGRRVRLSGRMLPTSLPARAFHLRLSKRVCRHHRCRYRRVRELVAPRTSRGRVELRFRLGRGRYRMQAVLAVRGYRAARSRTARVRVAR